jgi:ABC-type glycerol-3-phosphate transport system substrate-binding protein
MCRATKHPEAAWELEKFFATDEFQWLITKAGGIIFPAHKSVVHAPELFAAGPFPRSPKVTVDALAYARTEPYTPRYIELTGAMNAELNRIWSGESSVKDAVTRARAAMEPILAEVVAQMK